VAAQGTIRQWSPVRVTQILFALTLVGLVGGLLMVFSASYPLALARTGNAFSIVSRQTIYAALGFVLLLIAWKVPLQWLRRASWVLHLLVIALLFATLVVGKKVGDAQRWLELGPFQVQPSEFAKVTLVLCIAALAASWRDAINLSRKFWLWLAIFLCWVLTTVLVLKQPHLSGGLLLAVIGVAAMFFARNAAFTHLGNSVAWLWVGIHRAKSVPALIPTGTMANWELADVAERKDRRAKILPSPSGSARASSGRLVRARVLPKPAKAPVFCLPLTTISSSPSSVKNSGL